MWIPCPICRETIVVTTVDKFCPRCGGSLEALQPTLTRTETEVARNDALVEAFSMLFVAVMAGVFLWLGANEFLTNSPVLKTSGEVLAVIVSILITAASLNEAREFFRLHRKLKNS